MAYKVITKVLVCHLCPYLDELIGTFQGSFIPRRGTMQNVILAHKALYTIKKSKAKKGLMAIKVDLEKAYNQVSWDYLKVTLVDFGFPSIITNLILWAVQGSSPLVLWNGLRLDGFLLSRGLRQRDPLLPYLFVMCMERLTLSIQNQLNTGEWNPISLSHPYLSHLLFTNDVLLFCGASSDQERVVNAVLHEFCGVSDLKVNQDKSMFTCSHGVL